MLEEIETPNPDAFVLADLEAGVGTLSRMAESHVDYLFAIVEPAEKSIQVARRAVEMAKKNNVGRFVVLANRIRETAHLKMLEKLFSGEEIMVIPYDRAIEDADRRGVAPIDSAPDSPGVKAFDAVVQRLLKSVNSQYSKNK